MIVVISSLMMGNAEDSLVAIHLHDRVFLHSSAVRSRDGKVHRFKTFCLDISAIFLLFQIGSLVNAADACVSHARILTLQPSWSLRDI